MNNNTIKLKGLMIGNPYIDFVSGTETQIESYWGHQKLPLELWEKFRKNKCIISYNKNLKKTLKKKKCNQLSNKLINVVGKHNPYAMDYPLCISQQQDTLLTYHHQRNKTIKKEYIDSFRTTAFLIFILYIIVKSRSRHHQLALAVLKAVYNILATSQR